MLARGELIRDSQHHFDPQIPSYGYWDSPTPDVVKSQSGLSSDGV